MIINFEVDGTVCISMDGFIDNLLSDTTDIKLSKTPYSDSLLLHRPGNALDPTSHSYVRSMVARILYLAKKMRPDLLLAVSILASRVNEYNDDDLKKLCKLLGYIKATKTQKLRLKAEHSTKLYCYVDASYAIHSDARSHTAFGLTLGKGIFMAKSSKQRLVTRSSTEAELVAANEAVGHVLWTINFMESLGLNNIRPCVLYEDNQSTIHIMNGGLSSIKRTRHMNVRELFVKEKVEDRTIVIEYKPTDDMIVDMLTKVIRGAKFNKLRDLMLNTNIGLGAPVIHNNTTPRTSYQINQCPIYAPDQPAIMFNNQEYRCVFNLTDQHPSKIQSIDSTIWDTN
jgi:hypothetical protein